MKLQIIVILLVVIGITTGLAQIGEEQISITVTPEGKTKISQSLFPKTFVSSVDVHVISDKISNLLAIDEENIILGTTQNDKLLKVATLGASVVDLKYDADILSYESGVFRLKYSSELESKIDLPPLSKLVSLNTIPTAITEKEYILPPGDISLSFTIRPVISNEFFVNIDDSEQRIEAITAAKVEGFSANADEIQFIIKDKAIVLTIIPKLVMSNPNDALLNGETVEFSQFHQNSTHSWIRIDPHEKGLVRILDTSEKIKEGGGCLIATATYGTEMSSQVQFLREIRDNQLMNTESGASFVTGFNQLYYSFSPSIADYQRESQMFNEIVKIVITPMVTSLSIMTFAESENEILGLGIGVIVLNSTMYFVLPFVICYYGMNIVRTRRTKKSNLFVISSHNVLPAMKKSLFGIIALLVLTVSFSSTFESAYAADEDPIKMILDITYENIQDSRNNADVISDASETFFDAGEAKYEEAIEALEAGDIVTAKESALVAMALFEDAAEEIGALEEQASTQLPPGLGAGIGSASDNGISNGQGLGVGGIPPGILKQATAANIFEIQEQITDIDEEVDQLLELAQSNGIDVNTEDYEESINLAKEVLSNGDIPNAQAKLALANEIKGDIINQMNDAASESNDERVKEFVDNSIVEIEEMLEKGENLGLTKKAIKELENTLDVLKTGEIDEILEKTDDNSDLAKELKEDTEEPETPGNSGEDPGQNKEETPGNSGEAPGQNKEETPGNSGEAPGQNKEETQGNSGEAPGQNKEDNDSEDGELPPGFEAAGDNPSENAFANGNGLGVGNVPPGLAKLFDRGNPDGELPLGFEAAGDNPSENAFANGNGLGVGNVPPGLAKKFDDYSSSFEQSPDDFYENAFEGSIDDVFETNYDGTNKGNGNGKGTLDAHPGKSGEAPGKLKQANKDKGGNNNKDCTTGITDGEATNTSAVVGVIEAIQGFTALGNSCKSISNIQLEIFAPNGTKTSGGGFASQPYNFNPETNGDWRVDVKAQSFSLSRTMTVTGGPSADPSMPAGPYSQGDISLTGSCTDCGTSPSYFWEITTQPTGGGQPASLDDENIQNPTLTASRSGDYVITLVYRNSIGYGTDTLSFTVS